jgi:hypothetical protein
MGGRKDDLTKASRDEIARFARYANRRAFKGDPVAIEEIYEFKFNTTPYYAELAARMAAAIATDDHELTEMLTALCNPGAVKKIMPSKDRVSISGVADTHAKLKTKYAKQISAATQDYFDGLSGRVNAAIKHEVSAAKASKLPVDLKKRVAGNLDAAFWHDESDRLAGELQPIIHDLSEDAANDESDQIYMRFGVRIDPADIIAYAATLAQSWGDEWPTKITSTTKAGVDAIVSRYADDNNGTLDDLTNAVDSSYLFGSARADNIGETETSRTTGNAQHRTAVATSEQLDVPMMFNQSDFYWAYPAHSGERCHLTTALRYDDSKSSQPIGIDLIWGTVRDDRVCPTCDPRDGMYLSDITNY